MRGEVISDERVEQKLEARYLLHETGNTSYIYNLRLALDSDDQILQHLKEDQSE